MVLDDLPLNEREMRLVFHLIPAFSQAFFGDHEGACVDLEGLNKSHVHAIVFLKIHGPSAMSKVARFLGLEKGSFTPVANRLMDWGFVTREEDPADRRRQVLRLTDSGLEFAVRLRRQRGARFAQQVGKLSKLERRQFFQTLEKLELLLVKINGGPVVHPVHRFNESAEDETK